MARGDSGVSRVMPQTKVFTIPKFVLDGLEKALMEFAPRDAAKILRTGVTKTVKRHVVKDAQRMAPVGATGRLRASLGTRRPTHKRQLVLGADAYARRGRNFKGGYYAHLVEKGHRLYRTTRKRKYFIKHVAARSFLLPALVENRTNIVLDLNQDIRKAAVQWNRRIARRTGRLLR